MLPVRVSQSLNLQFGAFTVLVFHTAVLLSLIHSCRGQPQVVGPSQPIVAMVGEDVILPCHLDPVMDAFDMVLEWGRPDLDPRYVVVRRDGKEIESMKHQSYEGRTSLFTDQLKQGNISLKLSKVKLSDEGRYRFFSPQLGETAVQLVVGPSGSSLSAPTIIGSVVGIILLVLAVVFVVWKWRQNKIRNKKHHEDEETLRVREKKSNSISNNSEQESLMGRETDRGQLTAERETTNNVDEEQTGLQSQTVEETQQRESDRAQCAVSEGAELQSSVEGERQTDQPLAEGDEGQEETGTKPINERRDPPNPTERQTENNLKTEEEEEKIKSTDEVQCLMEEEKHEEQLTAEGETTTNVDEEQTGLQSQTVEETQQRQSDRAQCAVSEGTETAVDEERDAPNPAESDQRDKEDETKPVRNNSEQLMEGKQTENNLQTEEEEEKIQSADNETEERETLNDKEKEKLPNKLKAKDRELEKIGRLSFWMKDKDKQINQVNEQLEEFEKKLSRLKTQIKDKEEQINQVREQLEEVERQREQTERKLQSVNREEDQMDPETQKEAAEKHEAVLEDLERKKAELQKQLEKIQRQLEAIKSSESVMTQKIMKATKEKEEIIKTLRAEEAESQSDSKEEL